MWLTKRLLIWALFVSISGPIISAVPCVLIRWYDQGLLGIIFFIVMFPLYTVYILIHYIVDIMPEETNKLLISKKLENNNEK